MADNKTEQKLEARSGMTMEEVLKLVSATSAATVAAMQAGGAKSAAPVNRPLVKCHDCGQAQTGCGGEHIQLVVYPTRYPQHADYFPGVILNGIRYLSNDESHAITVPADAESTILSIVSGFETNEQELATGRKAERHSGRVSPAGASVQPANQAWR